MKYFTTGIFQELVEFVDFGDLETAEETKVRQILYGPRPQRDKKKVEVRVNSEKSLYENK